MPIPEDCVAVRCVPAHLCWSDVEAVILGKEDWDGNIADEQVKEGAEKSEPPQQMMSEYVQRRYMIFRVRRPKSCLDSWTRIWQH